MRLQAKPGFTIVEIAITLAIMAVLFGMVSIGITGLRSASRDNERSSDVEAIATYLDAGFRSGSEGFEGLRGSYPSIDHLSSSEAFVGLDPKSLQAPETDDGTVSLLPATNPTQTLSGVRPQPTLNTYIYQPLDASGGLCSNTSQECRKFNIFYKLETETEIQKVTSKNQ